jgi:hypothetical protein
MRAVLLAVALTGCATVAPAPQESSAEPPFRTCLALSPPLPAVRTVEAVKQRLAELEAKYRDCAERLRRVVEAWPK